MSQGKMHVSVMAAIILLSGNIWADQSGGTSVPGFDRVGTNITGGMRGLSEDNLQGDDAVRQVRTERLSARPAAERKGELARRMFWIMMSMR